MREIKFRAFIDGQMIDADSLAFENYQPLKDQLAKCKNVMQFTGITDENGIDIYEGDVVKIYDWNRNNRTLIGIGEVIWYGENLCYNTTPCIIEDQYDFSMKARFEVIGNIHQHSHLLP